MAKTSKRYRALEAAVENEKKYNLDEAISLLVKISNVKFDSTVDIAMNLGVDPRYSDQIVRGSVVLPNGTGKNVKVAAFVKEDKADEARSAGADLIGNQDLIDEILAGNISFDRCIATPDMMPVLSKAARVLGPRGLMPNPKLGTVSPDFVQAIKNSKGGQIEYRADKTGIIHAGVAKVGFSEDKIKGNIIAFIDAVQKAKPGGAKGAYMKKVVLSTTMSPSVELDVTAVLEQVA
jgi:large subunit ribosomal protein L1